MDDRSDLNRIHVKARKFCASQERCIADVTRKLADWNTAESDIEVIIRQLESENFLSDERFAGWFVQSKVNQNRWGRMAIEEALRQKDIPEKIIRNALKNIDEEQYLENLRYLMKRKEKDLNEQDIFISADKIKLFLLSKGYEEEYINRFF